MKHNILISSRPKLHQTLQRYSQILSQFYCIFLCIKYKNPMQL